MPDAGGLPALAHLGPKDRDRLVRNLYARKTKAYRDELLRLGRRHGLKRKQVNLSPEIKEALRREAEVHATSVIDTYNGYISAFVAKHKAAGKTDAEVGRLLPEYMKARAKGRLAAIDHTAGTTAKLDAQVSFYRENGVDPRFRFRGPRPKCPLCRALFAAESLSLAVVLSVGVPHLGCTHGYEPIGVSAKELREAGVKEGQITLGRGGPQGIVGGEALNMRLGSLNAASDYVRGQTKPEILQQFTDDEGQTVALSAESARHIAEKRASFVELIPEMIEAIAHPDGVDRTTRSGVVYRHFFRRGKGPTKWLRVTVKYVAGDRGYLVSARGDRNGPKNP